MMTGSTITPGGIAAVASESNPAQLHEQLLRATAPGTDAEQVRGLIRRAVFDELGAVCVVHLTPDSDGQFSVLASQSEGEAPPSVRKVVEALAKLAAARRSPQMKMEPGQFLAACCPIMSQAATHEVIAAVIPIAGQMGAHSATRTIELAAEFQRLWSRGHEAVASQWKLNSLAAIVELISEIELQHSVAEATNVISNRLSQFLGCELVALATKETDRLVMRSVAGLKHFDPHSESISLLREAMNECLIHDAPCQWPSASGHASAMLGHARLAKRQGLRTVLTAPLRATSGELVGACLIATANGAIEGERFQGFLRTAGPRIATALHAVQRAQQGPLARMQAALRDIVAERRGRVAALGIGLLTILMLLPVPYRVRCRCRVEPTEKRYAVAPFRGMVDEAFVEPGDIVEASTLLATMDKRELRWELSSAQAKLSQAEKQREVELTEGNVPQVLITQLEGEKLRSQIDLLQHRIDRSEMQSPIAGVVLTGAVEKGQSMPVDKGDLLYEVAPLDHLRIEVEIPANDVAQIRPGQHVKVWLDGFESEPVSGSIQSLEPQSQLRKDKNVFIAKVALPNPSQRYRPGMEGSARITGPRNPLAWNIFHKPWEYLVSRMTWW